MTTNSEVEKVLREATARPWGADMQTLRQSKEMRTWKEWEASNALMLMAVNSYEASEALVGRLVGALDAAREVLVNRGGSEGYRLLPVIRAVLAEAANATRNEAK